MPKITDNNDVKSQAYQGGEEALVVTPAGNLARVPFETLRSDTINYQTKTEMDDAGAPANGQMAKVWNDPTEENNGEYGWNGAAWVPNAFDVKAIIGKKDSGGAILDRLPALEADKTPADIPEQYAAAIVDIAKKVAAAITKTGAVAVSDIEILGVGESAAANGNEYVYAIRDKNRRAAIAIDKTGAVHMKRAGEINDPASFAAGCPAGICASDGSLLIGFKPDGTALLTLTKESAEKLAASLLVDPAQITGPGNVYNASVVGPDLYRYIADGDGGMRGYLQRAGSSTEMAETAGPIEFIAATGQSLSIGGGATENDPGEEVFTTSPIYPHHALMFNTGTRGAMASELEPTTITDLVPAFEVFNNSNQAETQGSGFMRALHAAELASGERVKTYVYRSHGRGGASINDLVKNGPEPMYENGLIECAKAVELAGKYGRDVIVRAITWTQGEQDRTGIDRATYAATLAQLIADYRADWAEILGPENPEIVFIIDQLSASASGTGGAGNPALAQYDIYKTVPNVVISTPKYFMEYSYSVHLKPVWYSILGEYQARAYREVCQNKSDWKPVSPISVTRTGAVIDIQMNVPDGSLVIDTTTLPAAENYGFEFIDDSGATPDISLVEILGSDTVRLTLSSEPTGNKTIRYAYDGPGATLRAGAWGNIHDSNNEASQSDPSVTLYNWLITFEEQVA